MESQGWIKLHRKFITWEWYDDPITKSVFLDLLLTANFDTIKYHGTTILRGQTIIGYSKMAKRLGISVQNARTAIKRLKSTSEITSQVTTKGQVITVTNYEKYQLVEVPSNNQSNNQSNNHLTSNQQATNNSKEYKELKKEKKRKRGDLLAFGENKRVLLSSEEHRKLCQRFGSRAIARFIKDVERWKISKGKDYVDDYFGILTFVEFAKKRGEYAISSSDFMEEDFDSKDDFELKLLNLSKS